MILDNINEMYIRNDDGQSFRYTTYNDPHELKQETVYYDELNSDEETFKSYFGKSASNAVDFAYKHNFALVDYYRSGVIKSKNGFDDRRKERRGEFIGQESLYDTRHFFRLKIEPNLPPVWAQVRMSSHPVTLAEWHRTHCAADRANCYFGLSLLFTDYPLFKCHFPSNPRDYRLEIYECRVNDYNTDWEWLGKFIDDLVAGKEPLISVNDIKKYIDPNYNLRTNHINNEFDPLRNRPKNYYTEAIYPVPFTNSIKKKDSSTKNDKSLPKLPIPKIFKLSDIINHIDNENKFEWDCRTYQLNDDKTLAYTTTSKGYNKEIPIDKDIPESFTISYIFDNFGTDVETIDHDNRIYNIDFDAMIATTDGPSGTIVIPILNESKSVVRRRSSRSLNESTVNKTKNKVVVKRRHP